VSRTELSELLAEQTPGLEPDRRALVSQVLQESRRMSTRTVVFHAAIADRLGLNASDHKCVDLICNDMGPITAGRLAEITGLSSGAITGVIDRLERAGFVCREHDAEDRRRVLIKATERAAGLRQLFVPMMQSMTELCESYGDAELTLIVEFMRRCGAVTDAQIQHLRSAPRAAELADQLAPATKPEGGTPSGSQRLP
jgi:DNA-binding MarR family transcriptional regulator